jgi:hypothetical protein
MSITESIEAEYSRPISELSTDVPLYWFCARALREGATDEAKFLWQSADIVWC